MSIQQPPYRIIGTLPGDLRRGSGKCVARSSDRRGSRRSAGVAASARIAEPPIGNSCRVWRLGSTIRP
jgi:hypothetical protein